MGAVIPSADLCLHTCAYGHEYTHIQDMYHTHIYTQTFSLEKIQDKILLQFIHMFISKGTKLFCPSDIHRTKNKHSFKICQSSKYSCFIFSFLLEVNKQEMVVLLSR